MQYDVNKIREDFPILSRSVYGKPLVYLDNGATTQMVTACGCATANRIPLLVLPGDTFACRQPDPVLQQAEFFDNYGRTVTDAFKGVCHYFDRINRKIWQLSVRFPNIPFTLKSM